MKKTATQRSALWCDICIVIGTVVALTALFDSQLEIRMKIFLTAALFVLRTALAHIEHCVVAESSALNMLIRFVYFDLLTGRKAEKDDLKGVFDDVGGTIDQRVEEVIGNSGAGAVIQFILCALAAFALARYAF